MSKDNKTNMWEEFYQADKTGWDRGGTSKNLSAWIDSGLLKPCRILIPGCGNGYEVISLVKLGFDVVAIDVAPSAINNLQVALDGENLHAELVIGDFLTWSSETPFDAIYEQTSLCALPPKEWKLYEKQLYQWLKVGGKIFAQFMQTGEVGGPPYHCAISDMEELFDYSKWQWSKEYEKHEMGTGKMELLYVLTKV